MKSLGLVLATLFSQTVEAGEWKVKVQDGKHNEYAVCYSFNEDEQHGDVKTTLRLADGRQVETEAVKRNLAKNFTSLDETVEQCATMPTSDVFYGEGLLTFRNGPIVITGVWVDGGGNPITEIETAKIMYTCNRRIVDHTAFASCPDMDAAWNVNGRQSPYAPRLFLGGEAENGTLVLRLPVGMSEKGLQGFARNRYKTMDPFPLTTVRVDPNPENPQEREIVLTVPPVLKDEAYCYVVQSTDSSVSSGCFTYTQLVSGRSTVPRTTDFPRP